MGKGKKETSQNSETLLTTLGNGKTNKETLHRAVWPSQGRQSVCFNLRIKDGDSFMKGRRTHTPANEDGNNSKRGPRNTHTHTHTHTHFPGGLRACHEWRGRTLKSSFQHITSLVLKPLLDQGRLSTLPLRPADLAAAGFSRPTPSQSHPHPLPSIPSPGRIDHPQPRSRRIPDQSPKGQ